MKSNKINNINKNTIKYKKTYIRKNTRRKYRRKSLLYNDDIYFLQYGSGAPPKVAHAAPPKPVHAAPPKPVHAAHAAHAPPKTIIHASDIQNKSKGIEQIASIKKLHANVTGEHTKLIANTAAKKAQLTTNLQQKSKAGTNVSKLLVDEHLKIDTEHKAKLTDILSKAGLIHIEPSKVTGENIAKHFDNKIKTHNASAEVHLSKALQTKQSADAELKKAEDTKAIAHSKLLGLQRNLEQYIEKHDEYTNKAKLQNLMNETRDKIAAAQTDLQTKTSYVESAKTATEFAKINYDQAHKATSLGYNETKLKETEEQAKLNKQTANISKSLANKKAAENKAVENAKTLKKETSNAKTKARKAQYLDSQLTDKKAKLVQAEVALSMAPHNKKLQKQAEKLQNEVGMLARKSKELKSTYYLSANESKEKSKRLKQLRKGKAEGKNYKKEKAPFFSFLTKEQKQKNREINEKQIEEYDALLAETTPVFDATTGKMTLMGVYESGPEMDKYKAKHALVFKELLSSETKSDYKKQTAKKSTNINLSKNFNNKVRGKLETAFGKLGPLSAEFQTPKNTESDSSKFSSAIQKLGPLSDKLDASIKKLDPNSPTFQADIEKLGTDSPEFKDAIQKMGSLQPIQYFQNALASGKNIESEINGMPILSAKQYGEVYAIKQAKLKAKYNANQAQKDEEKAKEAEIITGKMRKEKEEMDSKKEKIQAEIQKRNNNIRTKPETQFSIKKQRLNNRLSQYRLNQHRKRGTPEANEIGEKISEALLALDKITNKEQKSKQKQNNKKTKRQANSNAGKALSAKLRKPIIELEDSIKKTDAEKLAADTKKTNLETEIPKLEETVKQKQKEVEDAKKATDAKVTDIDGKIRILETQFQNLKNSPEAGGQFVREEVLRKQIISLTKDKMISEASLLDQETKLKAQETELNSKKGELETANLESMVANTKRGELNSELKKEKNKLKTKQIYKREIIRTQWQNLNQELDTLYSSIKKENRTPEQKSQIIQIEKQKQQLLNQISKSIEAEKSQALTPEEKKAKKTQKLSEKIQNTSNNIGKLSSELNKLKNNNPNDPKIIQEEQKILQRKQKLTKLQRKQDLLEESTYITINPADPKTSFKTELTKLDRQRNRTQRRLNKADPTSQQHNNLTRNLKATENSIKTKKNEYQSELLLGTTIEKAKQKSESYLLAQKKALKINNQEEKVKQSQQIFNAKEKEYSDADKLVRMLEAKEKLEKSKNPLYISTPEISEAIRKAEEKRNQIKRKRDVEKNNLLKNQEALQASQTTFSELEKKEKTDLEGLQKKVAANQVVLNSKEVEIKKANLEKSREKKKAREEVTSIYRKNMQGLDNSLSQIVGYKPEIVPQTNTLRESKTKTERKMEQLEVKKSELAEKKALFEKVTTGQATQEEFDNFKELFENNLRLDLLSQEEFNEFEKKQEAEFKKEEKKYAKRKNQLERENLLEKERYDLHNYTTPVISPKPPPIPRPFNPNYMDLSSRPSLPGYMDTGPDPIYAVPTFARQSEV
jgi:hypothetical protein